MSRTTSAAFLAATTIAAFAVGASAAAAPRGGPTGFAGNGTAAQPGRPPERADVGFVGLVSPDLAAAELSQVEASVEQTMGRQARVRGKGALLAALADSDGVASNLARARGSAELGGTKLDAFNLPAALEELGRSLSLYDAAFGTRLAPAEVAKVLERRAQAAYALRRPVDMRKDFARAVLLQPVKGLDERVFAPDATAAFAEEAAAIRAAEPVPPAADELAEIARRTGVRWAVAGEARLAPGGVLEIDLTIGSATGTILTRPFRAPRETLAAGMERAMTAMLDTIGVPRRENIAIPTPTPIVAATRPPRPRDDDAHRGPIYTRWYFWGGVLAAGAVAAYAGTAAASDGGGGGGGGTPEDPGVTIQFEDR